MSDQWEHPWTGKMPEGWAVTPEGQKLYPEGYEVPSPVQEPKQAKERTALVGMPPIGSYDGKGMLPAPDYGKPAYQQVEEALAAKANNPKHAGMDESAQRKASPVWSGVLNYFPEALMAVARISKAGNDKHNAGQPLHWSRDKSNDHMDCAARHLLRPYEVDPDTQEIHLANAVWRLLAELQLYEEKRLGRSQPRGYPYDGAR